MKHLKGYKLFENLYRTISDAVQKEADDYLANLKDNGYRISVSSYPIDDDIHVCILISGKRFKWASVKDDVKRFIEMTNNELDSIVCHNESKQVQTHFSSVGEVPHETEMSFLQLYFNYKDDGILETKSHTELDNDEIVEYVNSILLELDDLGTVAHEIVYFNKRGSMVYYVTNNIGTYSSRHSNRDIDKSLPIDRVDLIINGKGRNRFDYSDVSDVVNHINSYLWDRGFGQDPKASSYVRLDAIWKTSANPVGNCILIDYDGVTNMERMWVSFRKK